MKYRLAWWVFVLIAALAVAGCVTVVALAPRPTFVDALVLV